MSPDRNGSITATRVWKRFRADKRRRQLRDELETIQARLRAGNDRGWRWALRDVDFTIQPGEAVGLIGANGSGKSTLLKVLTRVMYPYAGRVEVVGRVGALIEVRAGLHPELTGKENVYLYGSLLGLPRREVTRRFDEIIEFAEVGNAIDRQVKHYSSGMQMRLGFAVAAFLEPDILLVDEVLSVGDAAFQQRCLDRMRTVLAQGSTLVFVSHDLAAVEAVSTRAIWLRNGVVGGDGPARDIIGDYRRAIEAVAEAAPVAGLVRLVKTEATGPGGAAPSTQEPLEISMVIESPTPRSGTVYVGVSEGTATPIFLVRRDLHLAAAETEARCGLPRLPLPRGRFYVWVGVFDAGGHELLPWHPATHFDVLGPNLDEPPRSVVRLAPVHVDARWEVAQR